MRQILPITRSRNYTLTSMITFSSHGTIVGRRKTAVASLEIVPGSGKIQINGCLAESFFSGHPKRLLTVQKPFSVLTHLSFDAKVKLMGGGFQRQSEALLIALTRSIILVQPRANRIFRKHGFLTRDSREKERRKYGLKKARKAPQFSKRLTQKDPIPIKF